MELKIRVVKCCVLVFILREIVSDTKRLFRRQERRCRGVDTAAAVWTVDTAVSRCGHSRVAVIELQHGYCGLQHRLF